MRISRWSYVPIRQYEAFVESFPSCVHFTLFVGFIKHKNIRYTFCEHFTNNELIYEIPNRFNLQLDTNFVNLRSPFTWKIRKYCFFVPHNRVNDWRLLCWNVFAQLFAFCSRQLCSFRHTSFEIISNAISTKQIGYVKHYIERQKCIQNEVCRLNRNAA